MGAVFCVSYYFVCLHYGLQKTHVKWLILEKLTYKNTSTDKIEEALHT